MQSESETRYRIREGLCLPETASDTAVLLCLINLITRTSGTVETEIASLSFHWNSMVPEDLKIEMIQVA